MTSNCILLAIAEDRIQFWTTELQAAFRDGNEERVDECQQFIAEYALLTGEVIKQLRISIEAESNLNASSAPTLRGR